VSRKVGVARQEYALHSKNITARLESGKIEYEKFLTDTQKVTSVPTAHVNSDGTILSYSLTHLLTNLLTYLLTHSLTHSLLLTHSLTHALTYLLAHSLLLAYSLTYSLTQLWQNC
jgi:hypothetical protein